MFSLFRSKPPIIIINNEAEQPAPITLPEKRTWWQQHSIPIFFSLSIAFAAILVFIVYTLRNIEENGTRANEVLLQQLHISDSLLANTKNARYQDSVIARQQYDNLDSTTRASFEKTRLQLENIVQQNRLLQRQYYTSLELMKGSAGEE
ncbi:hypothetical protein BH10BAC2_BH10BAC2_02570 [soil metagenome]